MARHLQTTLLAAAIVIATASIVNWAIDPYDIWRSPVVDGLNRYKPLVATNVRIFEIESARRLRPTVIILGSSRADGGLDPRHPAFEGKSVFNLAGPLQLYEETETIFQWAVDEFSIGGAVIALDFFAANAFLKPARDYQLDNFRRTRTTELLASLDTLADSFKTATGQARAADDLKWNYYREDGLRMTHPDKVRGNGGHRRSFRFVESTYLNEVFLPAPHCRFAFSDERRSRRPMLALQRILRSAYSGNIELSLAISPVHARMLETIHAAGLWNEWEQWKRLLVTTNHAEAGRAKRAPFPIHDFSGYSDVTTEAVPPMDDSESRMQWYWESSHYKQTTGNLMLTEMLGPRTGNPSPAPPGFAFRLTDSNLEQHLESIREARKAYALKFPADVAEVQDLAIRAVETRKSLGCQK